MTWFAGRERMLGLQWGGDVGWKENRWKLNRLKKRLRLLVSETRGKTKKNVLPPPRFNRNKPMTSEEWTPPNFYLEFPILRDFFGMNESEKLAPFWSYLGSVNRLSSSQRFRVSRSNSGPKCPAMIKSPKEVTRKGRGGREGHKMKRASGQLNEIDSIKNEWSRLESLAAT